MPKLIKVSKGRHRDLSGERFGRLVVVNHAYRTNSRGHHWYCQCDCGKFSTACGQDLKGGRTKSCGCLAREVIGDPLGISHTQIYNSWMSIRNRCSNPKNRSYNDYGGRGIRVCDGLNTPIGLTRLIKVIGENPTGNMTLDRKDNSLGYNCGSCKQCQDNRWELNIRWATRAEQSTNKRNNVFITFQGITKCRTQWAKEFGIDQKTLAKRLEKGWPFYKAATWPVEDQTPAVYLVDGLERTLSDLCLERDVRVGTVSARLKRGYSIVDALRNVDYRKPCS